MARTKQTARKSTGRKAPHKGLQEKKEQDAREKADQAAKMRAEKFAGRGDNGRESSMSMTSLESLSEAPESSAGAHAGDEHSDVLGQDVADDTQEQVKEGERYRRPSDIMDLEDDEEAEGLDVKPAVAAQQNLTASQTGTAPAGAIGDARNSNERNRPVQDSTEMVGVVKLITSASLSGWPSTHPKTEGNYMASHLASFNRLADDAGHPFGCLDEAHRKLITSLLGQREETRFFCMVRLAPLSAAREDPSKNRTVTANIDMVALRHTADSIRSEVRERGFKLHQFSASDTVAESVAPSVAGKERSTPQSPRRDVDEGSDFQAEASKHKADSRIDLEEDFEPTHPAKTPMSRLAAAYQMELKNQQSKTPTQLQRNGARLTMTTKPAPESTQSDRVRRDNMPSASTTAADEATQIVQISSERAMPGGSVNERGTDAGTLAVAATISGVTTSAQTKSPAPTNSALSSTDADISSPAPSSDDQSKQNSAQASAANVQQQTADSTPVVTDEQVADFLEYTDTVSVEQAQRLIRTQGSVKLAVRHFRQVAKAQKARKIIDDLAPQAQAAPPTLLEEALKAHAEAKDGRERQLHGDTVVILDGADLGRICRLNCSDLCKSSRGLAKDMFYFMDDGLPEVHGVRQLYTLHQSSAGQMPELVRVGLLDRKENLHCEIYSSNLDRVAAPSCSTEAPGISKALKALKGFSSNPAPEFKHENDDATQAVNDAPSRPLNARSGYEDFFCLVSRFRPKFCEAKDIGSAIDPLEAVAGIANHYDAVHPTSEVTIRLNDLFNRFVIERQLWQSVAADASRWLVIAVQLRNVPIFKEAFVHLAGSYPDWLGSIPQTEIPADLIESIEIKSSMLREERLKIERKLMFTTLSGYSKDNKCVLPVSQHFRPATYNVVNIWSDWIRTHLALLDDDSDVVPNPTPLCNHDDEECLSLAGFYSKVSLGGGYYLPVNDVIKKWNENFSIHRNGSARNRPAANDPDWEYVRTDLASLKKKGSELVAPLVKRNLEYKEKLKYLTCIEVEESDIPWEME